VPSIACDDTLQLAWRDTIASVQSGLDENILRQQSMTVLVSFCELQPES
jgi:hypothetical protein